MRRRERRIKGKSRSHVAKASIPDQGGARKLGCGAGHCAASLYQCCFIIESMAVEKIDQAAFGMTSTETSPSASGIDGIELWRTVNHFCAWAENEVEHKDGISRLL